MTKDHNQLLCNTLSHSTHPATRWMSRQAWLGLPLMIATLLATTGCGGDSPTGPGNPAADLTTYFAADEAVVTEQGSTSNLRMVGVQFAAGNATLIAVSLPVLNKFDTIFRTYPRAAYSIEGHTDSRGSSAYNLRLSQERADAVRDYFINELGGPAGAITAVGYGEDRPIDTNDTVQGRANNRRIDIVMQYSAGAAAFTVTF